MEISVLKNIITNTKLSWWVQQKTGEDKEIISELEDRAVEINQSEKQGEKRQKGKQWTQGTVGV